MASKAVEMFLIELKNIKSSLVNQQQIDHLLKTSEVKNIRLPITEFPSSDHSTIFKWCVHCRPYIIITFQIHQRISEPNRISI
jgi:hypothetical protein